MLLNTLYKTILTLKNYLMTQPTPSIVSVSFII